MNTSGPYEQPPAPAPTERDRAAAEEFARDYWHLSRATVVGMQRDLAKFRAAARAEGVAEEHARCCGLLCEWCKLQVPTRGACHVWPDGERADCGSTVIRTAVDAAKVEEGGER